MQSNIRIINQMVDTLKLHFYPSHELSDEDINSYNDTIEDLKKLKKEAQEIKSDIAEDRYMPTTIASAPLHVMAGGVKSFSVLAQNADIDLALKRITDKSSNPCIKVEFRSEFLTRFDKKDCLFKRLGYWFYLFKV